MKVRTKTIVYVDAFNLYYGALKGTKYRWLDVHALFSSVFPQNDIVGIRYFTARVHSMPSNPDQPLRQQLYFRALSTLPGLEIVEGHYLTKAKKLPLAHQQPGRDRFAEVVVTEEKGSDVNLASHLLLDAFKNAYDCAIVVSGDSDLATPITIARQEFGKVVGVLLPQRISGSGKCESPRRSAKLKEVATFFRHGIREGVLANSQFPATLADAQGQFHKPPTW